MVQVSRRSCIGKMKYCHIHDLLRELAIKKAKEDNFLTVVSKNDTKISCSTCARRVAIHIYGNEMIEHACTNLRSLINFSGVPNFNRFATLRVLHISGVPYEYLYGTNCLKGFHALTTVKYFSLEGDDRFEFYCNSPFVRFYKRCFLTYLKNLQMVRTLFCKSLGELPPSFWGNKQLRHVNFTCCCECKAPPEGPPSAVDLQSLLTLKGVRARQDWVAELPNFPYIRKLGIVILEDVAGEPLINLLSNLNHLGSLHIKTGCNNQLTFPYCISAFKNHKRLHSFNLKWGRWTKKEVGNCTLFPPYLVKLTLDLFDFEEDPMPQLGKLPNLRVLILNGEIEVADRKQMTCSRGGFGQLQRLVLHFQDLEEWKIEEGAMPMLNQLVLKGCRDLHIVPDLQYLANLQEFTAEICSDQLISRLQGEDQWKIKHIPFVIMY